MTNTQPIIIDTHSHTKASDGNFTPEERVAYAAQVGLEVIAKTDHDTVFGNDAAVEAGKIHGVKVIPGIEINAIYKHPKTNAIVKGIELLGLNIKDDKIKSFCKKLKQIRFSVVEGAVDAYNAYISSNEFKKRNKQMEFSIANPTPISIDDIVDFHNANMQYDNPAPFVSKTTVMNYLLSNQAEVSDKTTQTLAGNRTLGKQFKTEYKFLFGKKAESVSFYEAIDEVHAAEGTAVLAHPGRSDGYEGGMVPAWQPGINLEGVLTPEIMVADLTKHGLDGVELYNYSGTDTKHADQQEAINQYFANVAQKYGLLTTFGSDCHGPCGPGIQMGKFGGTVDYSHLLEK